MPYQSVQSYIPPNHHNDSILLSTQQTSNVSQLINNSDDLLLEPIQQTTSPVTPNAISSFTYNQLYGCRTILASSKASCKSDQEYFKLLYCMYTGCEGNAMTRINTLIENKHSILTIRSIKPVKKQSVQELLRRYSYLMLKEKGVLVGSKNFRPANNKSQEEINRLFQSPHFRLPAGEKLYLEFKMEEFISKHEKELKTCLDELQQLGSEIMKSDLRKMRL